MISGRNRSLDYNKKKSLGSKINKIKDFKNNLYKNPCEKTSKSKTEMGHNTLINHSLTGFELMITKILAIIVFGMGIVVTVGWIFDITTLEEVLPHAVNMKFSTSVSFIFSGIILYFIANMQKGKLGASEIAIAASGMVIFLFMGTLLVSNISGVYTGIENLFVKEIHDENTTVLGRPSIPTMVDFVMIVTAGIFSLSNYTKSKKPLFWIGLSILSSGGLGLIGYATNLPFLYYHIPGWSTGMAIHTSILFILSGIGLMILKSHYTTENKTIRSIRLRTRLTALFLISSVIPTIFIGTLSYHLSTSSESITILGGGILILVSVSVVGVIIFSLITSKFFSEPIVRLKKATELISEEHFETSVEEDSTDEFGELGRSFNTMVKNIQTARKKLVEVEKLELSEKRIKDQYQELKKTHEILSATEKKYRGLYEYAPDMLRSISEDGIILDCNENYLRSLGCTKDEVIGKSVFEHTSKKSLRELSKGMEEWKKTGKITNQTIWLKRKDGSEFPTLISGTSLYDDTGKIVGRTVSLRDMTEIYSTKAALEEEKAKRLMTVGELSSKLTHDIRNPLGVILNAAELLRIRKQNMDAKELSLINMINESASRISYQIQDVLNFVRSTDIKKESCSILQILNSCIGKIKLPDNIKLVLPKDDLTVDCDRIKLEIVFENIINNAIQAIDTTQGEITVAIRNESNNDVIEISDSGNGISPEVLPQIFEPLFTTKRSGTGLGLPTCKNLVEQHGWTIEAKLPSTFMIKIPRR
ncbi:ATP-binding protein [Candidatus Nitrosotalea okcheonensis]|uniref:histidine kinase n=1 Tax=Candidatus Nitrosotalea okcheonensis TaxID=1903276 RepID=A0A2H1FG51_9ARCH|nr:ATP-binding protein [Candidatus Nitrosotalea okcheonensis]SMH71724.1 putative Histidine kinase [Candidatus Nitrosotalea okcheonensis]